MLSLYTTYVIWVYFYVKRCLTILNSCCTFLTESHLKVCLSNPSSYSPKYTAKGAITYRLKVSKCCFNFWMIHVQSLIPNIYIKKIGQIGISQHISAPENALFYVLIFFVIHKCWKAVELHNDWSDRLTNNEQAICICICLLNTLPYKQVHGVKAKQWDLKWELSQECIIGCKLKGSNHYWVQKKIEPFSIHSVWDPSYWP